MSSAESAHSVVSVKEEVSADIPSFFFLQIVMTSVLTFYHSMGRYSRRQIDFFSYFSQKTRFDISCKLSPWDLFEMSNPFSKKNKKTISKCCLPAEILVQFISVVCWFCNFRSNCGLSHLHHVKMCFRDTC